MCRDIQFADGGCAGATGDDTKVGQQDPANSNARSISASQASCPTASALTVSDAGSGLFVGGNKRFEDDPRVVALDRFHPPFVAEQRQ